MSSVALNTPAPDFTLEDFNGTPVTLSEFKGKKHVVITLNRGFIWPFCRAHLAQLRQDYAKFVQADAEILSIGPENARVFETYWQKNDLPFIGLPDPKHVVLKLLGQRVKIFKYGRMPGQLIVDKEGIVRFVYYGEDMQDYPSNEKLLEILESF